MLVVVLVVALVLLALVVGDAWNCPQWLRWPAARAIVSISPQSEQMQRAATMADWFVRPS